MSKLKLVPKGGKTLLASKLKQLLLVKVGWNGVFIQLYQLRNYTVLCGLKINKTGKIGFSKSPIHGKGSGTDLRKFKDLSQDPAGPRS